MTLLPTIYNPLIIDINADGSLDVTMPSYNGALANGQTGDWIKWTLIPFPTQYTTKTGSLSGGTTSILSMSSVINGVAGPAANLSYPTTADTWESALQGTCADGTAQWWLHGGAYVKQTQQLAFNNGGGPELLAGRTVRPLTLVSTSTFSLQTTYTLYDNKLNPCGTWVQIHTWLNTVGGWCLDVEQILRPNPTNPINVQTFYAPMMSSTTADTCQAIGANLHSMRCDQYDGVQRGNGPGGYDFGPGNYEWHMFQAATPTVQQRMTMAFGYPSRNPDTDQPNWHLSSGYSHVQSNTDKVAKMRAMVLSYTLPTPWTEPLRVLNRYQVGVFT